MVVYAALVLVLLGLGCSNGPSADVPITAQLVLERGQEAVQSLKFFRGEYHFRLAKGDGGSLEETVIEAVVDFQAPDKMYTKGHATVTTASGVSTALLEQILIGKTQYFRIREAGPWVSRDVESSVDPEQLNPLNVLLDDSQIVGDLELEVGALLNGEEMFKVSWLAPTGIDLGFGEADRTRHIEYWIAYEDYLVKRFTYRSGSPSNGEGTMGTFDLSNFDMPVDIVPPYQAKPLPPR